VGAKIENSIIFQSIIPVEPTYGFGNAMIFMLLSAAKTGMIITTISAAEALILANLRLVFGWRWKTLDQKKASTPEQKQSPQKGIRKEGDFKE